jgi:hypothetical protein
MVAPRNAAFAEESAEVEVLYANLEKLKLLTKKIQGSLVRLETGGNVVKHAIGPIYSNTQSLQTTNSNIDKINEAIDRLRKPLDAKNREEGIIRAGCAASPTLTCFLLLTFDVIKQATNRSFITIFGGYETRGPCIGGPDLD